MKQFFVYVETVVALDEEHDGATDDEVAKKLARLYLLEKLQRDEVIFSVESEEV